MGEKDAILVRGITRSIEEKKWTKQILEGKEEEYKRNIKPLIEVIEDLKMGRMKKNATQVTLTLKKLKNLQQEINWTLLMKKEELDEAERLRLLNEGIGCSTGERPNQSGKMDVEQSRRRSEPKREEKKRGGGCEFQ